MKRDKKKMENKIKIIITDDHPIVRKGLRQVIESDSQLVVLAEANDGVEALALIEKHQPEVVILDVDMPNLDGFETAKEIIIFRIIKKVYQWNNNERKKMI